MQKISDTVAHVVGEHAGKNRRPVQLTAAEQDAIGEEIEDAQQAGTVGYVARSLVLATMPHSNPGDVPAWGRNNGSISLVMQPGYEMVNGQPRSLGLPYGTVPRLLTAWITTEAIRTQDPVLHLGASLSAWMQSLGYAQATGGRWGNVTRVREQAARLFGCSVLVSYSDNRRRDLARVQVADEAHLWWTARSPGQGEMWESTVTLNPRFYSEIVTAPVPIDLAALRALKGSSVRLDLYAWLSYRTFTLTQSRRARAEISWQQLASQLGSDYGRTADFKRKMVQHLLEVLEVYPANIRQSDDGNALILLPGEPHVRPTT